MLAYSVSTSSPSSSLQVPTSTSTSSPVQGPPLFAEVTQPSLGLVTLPTGQSDMGITIQTGAFQAEVPPETPDFGWEGPLLLDNSPTENGTQNQEDDALRLPIIDIPGLNWGTNVVDVEMGEENPKEKQLTLKGSRTDCRDGTAP